MVEMTKEIVQATSLPVTVKTRLGWDEKSIRIVEAAERLQDVGIQALTVHGRTRVQMYKGEADWTHIGAIKENPRMHIPIFGNGDVDSPQKALDMKNRFGVDGIMIGRASIGNPWIFKQIKHFLNTGTECARPTLEDRIEAARQHFLHSLRWKGDKLGLLEMRRHYGNYFRGLDHFKAFRLRLVTSDSTDEVLAILNEIREHYTVYA